MKPDTMKEICPHLSAVWNQVPHICASSLYSSIVGYVKGANDQMLLKEHERNQSK